MRILYYCLTLLFVTSCYSPERDCVKFHNGTFEFETIINNNLETSRFIRNDSLEIESYRGKIDSAKIRWVNDCECILTKLNPKNNQEKRPIRMRILTTTSNSYTFEYSLVGDLKNTQRGKITKIE
ncbi:MAG: hypothetical protein CMC79_02100 [Flavobacteriaceae bacterium]|nr:hypothetical protein [Flavobacteriaceae bacterium]|tara:strand:+ start:2650 stop:3024 length:375 start_codon:yes stop_codon:yes gene_type:complete